MKKILVSSLFIVASLCSTHARAQEKDADLMIQKIWTVVKNGDEQGYVKLFPDYQQTMTFFRGMAKNINDSAAGAKLEQYISNFTEKVYQDELVSSVTKDFSQFLVSTRKKGIDLNALSFDHSVYEIVKEGQLGINTKTLQGTIFLKNDTAEYELSFSQSIWLEANEGWYGAMLGRIKKKGEQDHITEVMPTEEIVNDTLVSLTEVEVPPPPPPAPAKEVKKKKVTTKSSPARKTKSIS
jgi:hypothetical protein